MAAELLPKWNATARAWVKRLYWEIYKPQGKSQTQLGADLGGLDQTRVSALLNQKQPVGTALSVMVNAGRLLSIPDDEIAHALDPRVQSTVPNAGTPEFETRCPPRLAAYLRRKPVPPVVARQLLAIYELDRRDRTNEGWRFIATAISMPADEEERDAASDVPPPRDSGLVALHVPRAEDSEASPVSEPPPPKSTHRPSVRPGPAAPTSGKPSKKRAGKR